MADYDKDFVAYRNNFDELYSVPSGLSVVHLDARATKIYSKDKDENAFLQCRSTLTDFIVPESSQLTEISSGTFYNCAKLSNIDLSPCTNLKSIGSEAFSYCSSLTTIGLPPSLTTLGTLAFFSAGLTHIRIPNTIETIGERCFRECGSLTEIAFDDGVTKLKVLNSYVFAYTNLLTFRMPQSVESLGWCPFEGIRNLHTLSVENERVSNYSIKGGMLCHDNALVWCPPAMTNTTLKIPDGITSVGTQALFGIKAKTIEFPSSLETIGQYACCSTDLESLVLPDTIKFINTAAFSLNQYLTQITLSNSLESLPDHGFQSANISSIVIPNSVKSIGKYCFSYCYNLRSITLPSGSSALGGGFIAGCSNINVSFNEPSDLMADEQKLIMNKNKTYVSQYFGDAENASIIIPKTIKTIKAAAFVATAIKTITFNSSSVLTTIEEEAFRNCKQLTTIELPSSCKIIKNNAFSTCTSLISMTFRNVTSIGESAFSSCTSLKSIKFENSDNLIIYKSCFSLCSSLVTVEFCEGLYSIGDKIFESCSSLTDLVFPSSLEVIGEDLIVGTKVANISFALHESNLCNISNNAFRNGIYLTDFEFIAPLETIGTNAFYNTKLSIVKLPSTVKEIGSQAFGECKELTTFELIDPNTSVLSILGEYIFKNCQKLSTINITNDHFITKNGALMDSSFNKLYAFPPASSIEVLNIPSTIKEISPYAFSPSKNLKLISIPSDSVLEIINIGVFEGCTKLRFINIPQSVKTFGSDCFKDCSSLSCGLVLYNKSSEFKEKLMSVGMPKRCFEDCSCTANLCSHRSYSILVAIFLGVSTY